MHSTWCGFFLRAFHSTAAAALLFRNVNFVREQISVRYMSPLGVVTVAAGLRAKPKRCVDTLRNVHGPNTRSNVKCAHICSRCEISLVMLGNDVFIWLWKRVPVLRSPFEFIYGAQPLPLRCFAVHRNDVRIAKVRTS